MILLIFYKSHYHFIIIFAVNINVTYNTINDYGWTLYRVPYEERKLDHSDKFGERESSQTCAIIMKETGAKIEISSSKDQSLTFLVTGKQNEVLEARRKILVHFQTQVSLSLCQKQSEEKKLIV